MVRSFFAAAFGACLAPLTGTAIVDTLKKRGVLVTELSTYNNVPVDYTQEQIEEVFKDVKLQSIQPVERYLSTTQRSCPQIIAQTVITKKVSNTGPRYVVHV